MDPDILGEIKAALSKDSSSEILVSSCPGRLSLSKHCDYINNDLLYTIDDRSVYCGSSLESEPKGKLSLINLDKEYENKEFDLNDLSLETKEDWDFYPRKLISLLLSLEDLSPEQKNKIQSSHIKLCYKSNLPSGNGLSSSHALILSTLVSLNELFHLKLIPSEVLNKKDLNTLAAQNHEGSAEKKELVHKISKILVLCQQVEHARGFKSGLGDQAAQLLGQANKFLFLKIYPSLDFSYIDIPKELAIVTTPSFIKADKSLPEFAEANKNIKNYKLLNDVAKIHFSPEDLLGESSIEFFGDLLYKSSDTELIEKLKKTDKSIRGIALYGLAEGARLKDLRASTNKGLDEKEFCKMLGKHLNLSHQAEQNFSHKENGSDLGNWEALKTEEKESYLLDEKLPLKDHSGLYSASTLANDQLQNISTSLDFVFGSSISGAGLGGSNIVLCEKGKEEKLISELIEKHYRKNKLEELAQDPSQGIHVLASKEANSISVQKF